MFKTAIILSLLAVSAFAQSLLPGSALAQSAERGISFFGPDQTIADISKLQFSALTLPGFAPGIEIASLRGDLAKGGAEIILRTPAHYTVPAHSHTSDEVYVWLKGDFTYVTDNGRQVMTAPAFISLPGNAPSHTIECGNDPCMFYVRYSRPFDLQAMHH
jgi:quercetin dioxygenase-like cupin family protein